MRVSSCTYCKQVDVGASVSRRGMVQHCGTCQRYLRPQRPGTMLDEVCMSGDKASQGPSNTRSKLQSKQLGGYIWVPGMAIKNNPVAIAISGEVKFLKDIRFDQRPIYQPLDRMAMIFRMIVALLFLDLCQANSNFTTTTTTGWKLLLEDGYLNPSGNSVCPSKCRRYFAGATAKDAVICQKQASGVGTSQQNAEFGVACYPSYGCGRDMITCVDQGWDEGLPNMSDIQTACSGLSTLVSENPWTCGTAEENRPACTATPNNNIGKWLLADAGLDCGWGSTYGGTYPGYSGSPTPHSHTFTVSSEVECCEKAMSFETSTWAEGGAALFFQLTGSTCRVDREKIIYANMDSSSGRSVKYQNTRCATGRLFYRHAAGAADAANLHTGGRCVVDGNFKRLNLENGVNLPAGEIYSMGQELPNHDCPTPSGESKEEYICNQSILYNTIADAEACCEQCRSMSWLPQVGGSVETDANGNQINPCVAWQIVEGRCRINRKYYFDRWNPGQTVEEALKDTDYGPPGNSGWLVSSRGCGTSVEACNYYSYIYYREVSFQENGTTGSGQAMYRKIVTPNITEGATDISLDIQISSVSSRHDRRLTLYSTDSDTSDSTNMATGDGTDQGKVELYASTALRSNGQYDIFDEDAQPTPLCTSELITSGSTVSLTCDLTNSEGRRLMSNGDLVLSFSAVGSGYDQVDFVTNLGVETTTTTTTTSTTTTSETSTTATSEKSDVTDDTTSTTTSSDTNISTTKREPGSSATRHVFTLSALSWCLISLLGQI